MPFKTEPLKSTADKPAHLHINIIELYLYAI